MDELLNSEIYETREILQKFFEEAEYRDFFRLRDNTLGVLQGLGLSILNRMDLFRLQQMSRSIKRVIGNFLRKTKNGFQKYSKCLACKVALRVLLYGFAATIGIVITAINTQFNGIVDLLSKFFEQSLENISQFLTRNGFQIAAYNLFDLNDLIERLCEEYGWC